MLIVKNFGPLKNIEMNVKDNMVIIGPQSSGKSTILKTLAIMRDNKLMHSIANKIDGVESFYKKFEEYQISFFSDETYMSYESVYCKVIFENRTISITNCDFAGLSLFSHDYSYKECLHHDILSKKDDKWQTQWDIIEEKAHGILLDVLKEKNPNIHNMILSDLLDDEMSVKVEKLEHEIFDALKQQIAEKAIDKAFEHPILAEDIDKKFYYNGKPFYIPAERSFVSLFSEHAMSFINQDISVPKYVSEFFAEFEKARNDFSSLSIPFLDIEYKYDKKINKDIVTFPSSDNLEMKLSSVSSGLQTTLPLIVMSTHLQKKSKYVDLYIEEPELNLYPTTQRSLIEFLSSMVNEEFSIVVATHSPYVLTSYNLLLLAFKIGNISDESRIKVKEIIDEKYWLSPVQFNAFYIQDGEIECIFDEDTKLISDNEIDDVSIDFSEILESLYTLYTQYKVEK